MILLFLGAGFAGGLMWGVGEGWIHLLPFFILGGTGLGGALYMGIVGSMFPLTSGHVMGTDVVATLLGLAAAFLVGVFVPPLAVIIAPLVWLFVVYKMNPSRLR